MDLPASVTAALVAGVVSLVVALVAGAITVFAAERKLRRDYRLEFAAESAAHRLLNDPEWSLRTFKIISHHLAGFEDNELRKVLVRAGAIRFTSKSGVELWGLLERNQHLLGVDRTNEDPTKKEIVGGGGGGGGWSGRHIVQAPAKDDF
jgi:hypothetical protein